MSADKTTDIATRLIDAIAALLPEFLADPADLGISNGNVSAVAIDASGQIHGRIFGTDRDRSKFSFDIVNRKTMQVRMTGYPTGRFEELVFGSGLNPYPFGINPPDFVGWSGGVPLLTPDGDVIAAACSGMRGESDVAIVEKAAHKLGLKVMTGPADAASHASGKSSTADKL